MYKNIFAALFEWNVRRWHGDDDMAAWMTAIGLGGALVLNAILVFIMPVVIVYGPLQQVPDAILFIIPVTFLALSYNMFLRRNRYVEIVGRFRGLPDSKRRRFPIVAWAYLTASLGLPGVVLLLMMRLTGQ